MLCRQVCEKCKEYWPVFKVDWVCICDFHAHRSSGDFDVMKNKRSDGGEVPPYCRKKFEHAIAAGRQDAKAD